MATGTLEASHLKPQLQMLWVISLKFCVVCCSLHVTIFTWDGKKKYQLSRGRRISEGIETQVTYPKGKTRL